MNTNLPPIQVWVRNEFLFWEKSGYTYAHLISVRSLLNQALQFSVLTSDGALYTGLPSHAIAFRESATNISLQESSMWDNVSKEIQVITFDTLRYMECQVKTSSGSIVKGEYLFTIDYIGHNDLAASPEHWKQVHVIKSECGNMFIYPQYRIQFKDKGLCFDSNAPLGDYKYNRQIWTVGS